MLSQLATAEEPAARPPIWSYRDEVCGDTSLPPFETPRSLWMHLDAFLPTLPHVAAVVNPTKRLLRNRSANLCIDVERALSSTRRPAKALVWPSMFIKGVDGCMERLRQLTIVSVESRYVDRDEDVLCPIRAARGRRRSVAVPYPTHFHAKSDAAMAAHADWIVQSRRRAFLTAYAAAAHGEYAVLHLRQRLAAICLAASANGECKYIPMTLGRGRHYGLPLQGKGAASCAKQERHWRVFTDAYAQSDFCLMPPGDSATRQAIFDALLCGCIPVFFSTCLHADLVYETMYEPFAPRHERRSWGAGAWAVVLNASAAVEERGSEYILQELKRIPPERREAMRQRIAGFASRLQYAAGQLTQFKDAARVYSDLMS